MLPNFLIIGAQKSGTTSVYNILSRHPDFYMPDEKEISYFHGDELFARGVSAYESCFKGWNGQEYVGNAPVNVLYLAEKTAKRIYEFNKKMRLIAILRNPIDRAYSAYWYFRRTQWEKSNTFEEAIRHEPEIIKRGNLYQKCNLTHVHHGFYYDQLKIFLSVFSREQVLVLFYDELKEMPEQFFSKLSAFFNSDREFDFDQKKRDNAASLPKFVFMHKLIYQRNVVKTIYSLCLPERIRHALRNKIVKRITSSNLKPFKYPPMNLQTREYLREVYRKPNKRLEELVNVDLSHWT